MLDESDYLARHYINDIIAFQNSRRRYCRNIKVFQSLSFLIVFSLSFCIFLAGLVPLATELAIDMSVSVFTEVIFVCGPSERFDYGQLVSTCDYSL